MADSAAYRPVPRPEDMTSEALFDMVAEYRNAPSNTASAMTSEQWAQAWQDEWQRANRAEAKLEELRERRSTRRLWAFSERRSMSTPNSDAAYRWEFACGHVCEGGNECADECSECGERDLVRKTPAPSAACDHYDGTGEVLEPSRTLEEPSRMIPCANCQDSDAARRKR